MQFLTFQPTWLRSQPPVAIETPTKNFYRLKLIIKQISDLIGVGTLKPVSGSRSTPVCTTYLCKCRLSAIESLLLLNRLRYQNMNSTMLSQIVWVNFLAHQVYQKVQKITKKKCKSRFYDFLVKTAWSKAGHFRQYIIYLKLAIAKYTFKFSIDISETKIPTYYLVGCPKKNLCCLINKRGQFFLTILRCIFVYKFGSRSIVFFGWVLFR